MNNTPYTREEILEAARTVDVSVTHMPLGRAVAQAQDHYNTHNPTKPQATPEADHHFLERITVNYLRHVCSHYDHARTLLRGITDPRTRNEAGAIIKGRLLADIARKYPALAEEAKRQAHREDNKPHH